MNSRTYSRLSSKRKQNTDTGLTPTIDQQPVRVRKRHRVDVEIVHPLPTIQPSSSAHQMSSSSSVGPARGSSTDTEERDHKPARNKPIITYGSSKPTSVALPASSPSTPSKPKPARDLTRIFDSAVTPTRDRSPPSSPNKLAKRMLARSRTESALGSPSRSADQDAITRTSSLPSLLSSPSLRPNPSVDHGSSPLPPLIPVTLSSSTTTRTYAGKSRSFLVSLPTANLGPRMRKGIVDLPIEEEEEDEFTARESYTSLRTRWGVDNSEDDPHPSYPSQSPSPIRSNASSPGKGKGKASNPPSSSGVVLPVGVMNPLKSITELRSKGESRRFLDEVGYLFEGMDGAAGIGLRRASALEIVTKLCDAEFTRKAKAADFLGKMWDLLREAGAGDGDKILDTLLTFFAALVARDPVSLSELTQRPPFHSINQEQLPDSSVSNSQGAGDFVSTLFTLLSPLTPSTDPLTLATAGLDDVELKKGGIVKKDRALLTTIHTTISTKSSLFPSSTSISTRLLITQTLAAIPPHFLLQSHFPALLQSLNTALAPLSTFNPALCSSDAHDTNSLAQIPFAHIYNTLRLLDSFLLGQWSHVRRGDIRTEDGNGVLGEGEKKKNREALGRARDDWLADGLVMLGVAAELVILDGQSQSQDTIAAAHQCTEMALRVLVSLTHANERWCRKIIRHELTVAFIMRTIVRADRQRRGISSMSWNGEGKDTRKSAVKKEEENDEEREMTADDAAQTLDRLCLALGLLTNLVQVVEEAKVMMSKTRLDPSCTLQKRACIRVCTCRHKIGALEALTQLYVHQLPPAPTSKLKSEPEEGNDADPNVGAADADFLRGHLSVLFGLLMRGSPGNRAVILDALPGGSSRRAKLGGLVEQAREFVALYAEVSGRLQRAREEGDVGGVDVGVRGVNFDGVREGEGMGEDVARDVVVFLEELRDASV